MTCIFFSLIVCMCTFLLYSSIYLFLLQFLFICLSTCLPYCVYVCVCVCLPLSLSFFLTQSVKTNGKQKFRVFFIDLIVQRYGIYINNNKITIAINKQIQHSNTGCKYLRIEVLRHKQICRGQYLELPPQKIKFRIVSFSRSSGKCMIAF